MKKVILLFFIFGSMFNIMAQNKINLDTLNIEQLNLYLKKANNMSSTGLILTITGGIISATTLRLFTNYVGEHGFDEDNQTEPNTYAILNLFGDAAMIVGIPLWVTGRVRKKKAQLTLQKFKIEPENSMAVGLGITLKF
jgi:NH3-dependent NAD+ synthetase